MSDQNSRPNNTISPDTLQNELSIKRATYYADLKHLGIIANKDEEGKPYLTFEEAEQVRALRSYVIKYGSRKGFVYEKVDDKSNIETSIVKSTNNSIETTVTSTNSDIETAQSSLETEIATTEEEDIYISETRPTDNIDLDNLVRNAQELAARNIAIPSLIAAELAENMGFDDLPPDLQEKVRIAKDAANPKKYQPKTIALDLLKQLRSQRAS